MSITSFLLSPLLTRISKKVESDVADVTERAVLAGAARGMNSASQKLGLVGVAASDHLPEIPALILSPEDVSEVPQNRLPVAVPRKTKARSSR